MKQYQKTLFVWLIFGFFIITVWSFFGQNTAKAKEESFSQVLQALEQGRVEKLTIQGQDFSGQYKDGAKFHSVGVLSDHILEVLDKAQKKHSTSYKIQKDEGSTFWMIVLQLLPMLLLVALFLFFMRQLQSGGGRAMSFGKSKAKIMSESQNKVTFKDVAGVDECKQELQEIVDFLKKPSKFTRLGGRIPKGVLLMGPPGTGKTLLAKAIAGEAGVPFFTIAGSDFVEMFVGVGASRVRDLFEQGKKNAPCIIFIDEIDAVGRHRGAGMGGGHDEREQTLNQLLVEMDGFESNEGVIIIAATNRPDVLDPAILRPGRFDRRVTVPLPDLLGREEILKVHTKKVPLSDNVDIEVLGRSTPGMSGADIENMVNEAALIAAKVESSTVAMHDFELAREKIMMGTERKSMVMSKKELKNTAYHESGHALIALLLPSDSDPVHKVSIIPRGMALGLTMQLPEEDRYSMSKTYAENQIAILMGGRIAEELISNELTSGAGNDFERATHLARKMICEWGMSTKLGPLTFGKKDSEVFLGRDFAQHQNYSEKIAESIDAEVRDIIIEQYNRSRKMLEENMDNLHLVAKNLLEYETLDGIDIQELLSGKDLKKLKPKNRIKTREQVEADKKKVRQEAAAAKVDDENKDKHETVAKLDEAKVASSES